MEQEFYSIKELAVIFAVNAMTIRRAIHKGFIPAIRVGDGRKSPYRISKRVVERIHQSELTKQLKEVDFR